MIAVFAIILVALVLFATEPVPIDITAIGIMVSLMILGAGGPVNLTDISAAEGTSGLASSATLPVLAMFVLSAGIQRTGIVQTLGRRIARITRDSLSRQLGATMTVVGLISGFINNTAAVAIFLPMVTDLAQEGVPPPQNC
jgi:Na+/H+ antiporter NhaD/arsenite permease-like protein